MVFFNDGSAQPTDSRSESHLRNKPGEKNGHGVNADEIHLIITASNFR